MQACSRRRIGDYWVEENEENKLGEGAFGKVYRAEHVRSGMLVAVKKLAKEKVKFDELRAVRKLINENVIGIIDLCTYEEDDDAPFVFIVLEFCDSDLHSHLKNQTNARLDNTDLDLVIESLSRGCLALYELGIVHRDIKPENILLKYSWNGRLMSVKIGDFGTSRLVGSDEDDQEKTLCNLAGTPLYMAPEIGANILADRLYNGKVDMWSVGVVLYECIHGQIPFDEPALCRLFLFAANDNYEGYIGPPNNWPQSMSMCYQALVNRLLELDVSERLSPRQFYCWIVHQKLLIDQTAVIDYSNGHKRRFRLRGGDGCCGGMKEGPNLICNEQNNNNNNIKPMGDEDCVKCTAGHIESGVISSHSSNGHLVDKKYRQWPWSQWFTIPYAIERCLWFSSMFVACNYCCFSMRHYAYDA